MGGCDGSPGREQRGEMPSGCGRGLVRSSALGGVFFLVPAPLAWGKVLRALRFGFEEQAAPWASLWSDHQQGFVPCLSQEVPMPGGDPGRQGHLAIPPPRSTSVSLSSPF